MATPSHVDLSVLWVPIMPETSKLGPAMEDAGKDATEHFGKGAHGLGDKIHDSFTKATGKVKDVFSKAGSDAGTSMSDSFRRESKGIEQAAADSGSKAGGSLVESFVAKTGLLKDYSGKLGEQIGGALRDKVDDALKKLDAPLKDIGIDIGAWQEPLQKVGADFADIKGSVEVFAGTFKDMPGIIGKVGAAIGELAVPLAAGVAGGLALRDVLDKIPAFHNNFFNPDGSYQNSIDTSISHFLAGTPLSILDPVHDAPKLPPAPPPIPGAPTLKGMMLPGAGPGGHAPVDPRDPFSALLPPTLAPSGASAPSTPPQSSDTEPPHAAPSSSTMPSSFVGSMPTSVSGPADLHAAGSRVQGLYSLAQSLQGTPYSQQLRNDCSGMVSRLATAAVGMTPSVQFSTVNEGDWLFSHGFQPGLGGPGDLNIGWWDRGGGNAGHTAATLPGGVNAESGGSVGSFALGGSVGASSSQFTQHAHLAMDGSIPSGFGAGGFGGGGGPAGTPTDPLFVALAGSSVGGAAGAGGGGSVGGGGSGGGGGMQAPDFLGGAMQGLGLDGSVFHTFNGKSSPLDFGAVKMGTGLLNAFLPLAGMDASHGALPGIMPTPDGASPTLPSGGLVPTGGGGMGGAGFSMGAGKGGAITAGIGAAVKLGGALFSDLFNPGPGAPDSAGYPGGLVTHNTTTNNVDNSFTVHGGQGESPDWKPHYNAAQNRYGALTANLPTAGG